jgi:hypothetical protein
LGKLPAAVEAAGGGKEKVNLQAQGEVCLHEPLSAPGLGKGGQEKLKKDRYRFGMFNERPTNSIYLK